MTWSMRMSWDKLLSSFMLPSAPPTRRSARRWTSIVWCAPFDTRAIAHTRWYLALLFIFSRSQKPRTWWTELSVVCQSPASKCVWQLSGMTSFCFSLLSYSETDSDFNGFLAFVIPLRAVWKCWVVSAPSSLHQWKLNKTGHVSCEQIICTHIFVCAYCIHKYIYVWMYICVHIYTYAYLLIAHTQQLELHNKNKYLLFLPLCLFFNMSIFKSLQTCSSFFKPILTLHRCLHSLSRSVQQLRTSFHDHAVWKPLMKVSVVCFCQGISAYCVCVCAHYYSSTTSTLPAVWVWRREHAGTWLLLFLRGYHYIWWFIKKKWLGWNSLLWTR